MTKVLSEKNKLHRAIQQHYRVLKHRTKSFYPVYLNRDKAGKMVPHRRDTANVVPDSMKPDSEPPAEHEIISIDEASQLTDEVIQLITEVTGKKVGTIGHVSHDKSSLIPAIAKVLSNDTGRE